MLCVINKVKILIIRKKNCVNLTNLKIKKEYYIRNLIIITKKIFIRKLHQITGVNMNKIINKMITFKKKISLNFKF